jgi:hypothetical protein
VVLSAGDLGMSGLALAALNVVIPALGDLLSLSHSRFLVVPHVCFLYIANTGPVAENLMVESLVKHRPPIDSNVMFVEPRTCFLTINATNQFSQIFIPMGRVMYTSAKGCRGFPGART